MRCTDGLFRGADTLTAGEAADAVVRAAGLSLAAADAALPLTETALAELLSGVFPEEEIESAMSAIALHGGEIRVEESSEKGTTMAVKFPTDKKTK